jgi:2-oxoacid dehydrogenases acyltransferase (catalytic domain)
MPHPFGRKLALSLSRRLACDLVHFAHSIPSVPVQRRMNVAALVAAREATQPRPGWRAIFAKALGMVAVDRPELRRALIRFPKAHLYEHPVSVAAIPVERQLDSDEAVLFAHIVAPEQQALVSLDAQLRAFDEQPLDHFAAFRRALRISRWPRLVRHMVWWFNLTISGSRRVRTLGTFAVCSSADLGASALHPLTPLPFTLDHGAIEADGTVEVRMVYDHRVTDGAQVARILHDLERVLNCAILSELRYLQSVDAA